MIGLMDWVRFPHQWVLEGSLKELTWKDHGAVATVALMILAPLAHTVSLAPDGDKSDFIRMPFRQLTDLLSVSKPKLAPAFDILEKQLNILSIERPGNGKSNRYRLHLNKPAENGVVPFVKLPGRSMYSANRKNLEVFREFNLRNRNELNALKLFYLFVALRAEDGNAAKVNFEKISHYTGVREDKIKSATSLLVNAHLIQIDQAISSVDKHRHNLYRIVGVKPRLHSGTINRFESAGPVLGTDLF